MKKLFLALALILAPSLAFAQCTGVFPANTLCGNLGASPAPPSAFSSSGTVVGPGSSVVGDVAVWNNTFGTLLKDVPLFSVPYTIGYGSGATATTLGVAIGTLVIPEMYGASCNGSGDDGPAIQRGINSISGPVFLSLSGTCVYRVVTGITINKKGVIINGAGRHVSVIDYEPGANGTLFTVGDGITRLYWTQLRGFSIISGDTTHVKVGFKLIDVSETVLSSLSCSQANITSGIWQGGGGSTCLQTNGRDTTVFEKLLFYGEQPIVLNPDPAIYISTDHFVFRDVSLIASGFPCITASDGIVMTNTSFEGYQTWNTCTYGFFANDTTSVQNWNNVAFHNVRVEQTSTPGAFSFFISVATGNRLIGLTIDNTLMDSAMKGVFLHNVQNATIQNSDFTCNTAAVALDVNASNDNLHLINDHFEAACTMANSSGGGNLVLQQRGPFPSTASQTIPSDAIYSSIQTVSGTFVSALNLPKISPSGVAPGAGMTRLEAVHDAGGGCSLMFYAGTSTTPTLLGTAGAGC